MKVTVLVGASGCGKSTWASENCAGAIVVSADHYFVGSDGVYRFDPRKLTEAHAACMAAFIEAVQSGQSVVVDNTNTTTIEIAPYVAVARAYGVVPEIRVWAGNPSHDVIRRNTHGVPPKSVEAMWERVRNMTKEWPPFWPRPVVMPV